MSIHKKRDKYYYAVYKGMKNGKREYEWSEAFENKKDAQLAELEEKKNTLLDNHKVVDKHSFRYVAELWLKMREKTVSITTYKQNKTYYDTYIATCFDNKIIKNIESADVLNFMLDLTVGPGTVSKIMSVLKMIFDFSVDPLKQRRDNPCIGVKKPAIKKKKKKTWSEREISNFLNLKDTKDSSCYLAFLTIFSTGMRPGEVCGLRWCDWEDDCLTPTVGISRDRDETDLKNETAHNEVYIGQEIITNLKRTKIAQKSLYMEYGKAFTEEGYINALTPDFRPMTPEYLTKTLKKICHRNNLPILSIYGARHSLGTNMMRNGVNPKVVAEIMRHSSVRTTLDNYSHVDKDLYKQTIASYNDKFKAK